MKPPISERIVKPENCVIAFGIPTTREAFYNHLKLRREFASMYFEWSRYNHFVAAIFARVEPALRELGVRIRTEITLSQFGQLFTGEFDVVILFAHWRQGAIEFADGLAEVSSIVPAVPREFNGLLDLCVCHPTDLVIALERTRSNLLKKYLGERKATPRVWLNFYVALFTHLRDENVTYLKGIEDVIHEFLNGTKSGRRRRP